MVLNKYDSDTFMVPIWEGNAVYHEPIMFYDTADGFVSKVKKLLYPIDEIISVRNNNLDKEYIENVDYKVENGKLIFIEGGNCPLWNGYLTVPVDAKDDYFDPTLSTGTSSTAASWYRLEENGDKGLNLIYDAYHENVTLYVSYTHSKTWADLGEEGYTPIAPENKSEKVKYLYEKLASGKEITALVHGDSSAISCSSTGTDVNYDRFSKSPDENGEYEVILRREKGDGISAPTFFEQATNEMVKRFGKNNKVSYYNIARGATGAKWGNENLLPRVEAMNKYYGKTIMPDIIFIKYFGNDIRTALDSYRSSFEGMIEKFQKLYPEALIVLVSGKINNEKCYIFKKHRDNCLKLQEVLCDMENKYDNCVAIKATDVWVSIVKSKEYEDYLSNNINHANDFWAKITAQLIVGTIEKK